jgi:hypothetical protein
VQIKSAEPVLAYQINNIMVADTGAAASRPLLLVSAPIAGRDQYHGPADDLQLGSAIQ